MKRLLVLGAAAAVAVVVVAVNATAGHKPDHGKGRDQHGGKTVTVVERATTDAVTNGDAAHDVAGNILTFANEVYDRTNTTKVGTDQGSCTRIVVGKSWECTWTTFLPGGQITVEGPFYDDARNSTLAITGGTGAYRNVRGQMDLKYRNPAGTEFDFVFHLIG
jgi:allene oxide cyclase